MKPTMYLRFVEREEHEQLSTALSRVRRVRILQQFWEIPTDKDIGGSELELMHGVWQDVQLIEAE